MIPTTHKTSSRLSNIFMIEQPSPKTKVSLVQYSHPSVYDSRNIIFHSCVRDSVQVTNRIKSKRSDFRDGQLNGKKLDLLASQNPDEYIRKSDKIQSLEQWEKTKLSTRDSTDKMRSPALKMNLSTTKTDNSTSNLPISDERFRFNAADYLLGAYVETHLSSKSSFHTTNQWESNLVLLDRPQPPADKTWCSKDMNPVLTIHLAKYIKPISVSYQHSKWNETIPNEAPKTYDVVACLDCNCRIWEPLALNCHYSEYEPNGSEQMCNISSDLDVRRTGKIQFRFLENYGDPNMTCVSLVRVYGETKTPVKMEKHLNSEKTCADLKWNYHNSYICYLLADKSCRVLYENECCSECPECCQECSITEYRRRAFKQLPPIVLLLMIWFLICIAHCFPSVRENLYR